jgi:hypothetical protein
LVEVRSATDLVEEDMLLLELIEGDGVLEVIGGDDMLSADVAGEENSLLLGEPVSDEDTTAVAKIPSNAVASIKAPFPPAFVGITVARPALS